MFNKQLKSLTAIKGKKAEDITAEEITAVNTELQEEGFEGITVAIAGSQLTAEDLADAVSQKETELNTAHQTTIEQKDDIIALRDAKITELEQIAAGETPLEKEGDNAHKGKQTKKSRNDQFKEQAAAQAKALRERAKSYKLQD